MWKGEQVKMLKTIEVGEMLGIHQNTVYKRILAGELRASRVGRLYLIDEKDLQEYIESSRTS